MLNILRSGGRRGHQSESSLSKLTLVCLLEGEEGGDGGEGGTDGGGAEKKKRLGPKALFLFFSFFFLLFFFPCEVGERNELWNCDFFFFPFFVLFNIKPYLLYWKLQTPSVSNDKWVSQSTHKSFLTKYLQWCVCPYSSRVCLCMLMIDHRC